MKKVFSFNTSEFFLHKNVLSFFFLLYFFLFQLVLPFFFKIRCKRHFWKSENFGPEKAHEKLDFWCRLDHFVYLRHLEKSRLQLSKYRSKVSILSSLVLIFRFAVEESIFWLATVVKSSRCAKNAYVYLFYLFVSIFHFDFSFFCQNRCKQHFSKCENFGLEKAQ